MACKNGYAMVLDDGLVYIDGKVYFEADRIMRVTDNAIKDLVLEASEEVDETTINERLLGSKAFAIVFKQVMMKTVQEIKEAVAVSLSELNN